MPLQRTPDHRDSLIDTKPAVCTPPLPLQIVNCTSICAGQSSLVLTGTNNLLEDSRLSYAGCAGAFVSGGDVPSLTRGNNVVQSNTISCVADVQGGRNRGDGDGW